MTIEEFNQTINANRENPRVKSFLASLEAATPDQFETILTPQLSADIVAPWLESKDAFPVLQPRLDRAKNDALAKFREHELPKIQQSFFEAEYAKKHPPTSEEAKALAELKQRFADMERKEKLATIREKALKAASEKKIPVGIIDLLSMDEEETTLARIDQFAEILANSTNSMVEERLKGVKPEPRAGTSGPMKLDANAPLEARLEAKLAAASQPKGV